MRLSSIIVFAAFALLSPAYPIDGYNQGDNSLWKRVTGATHTGGEPSNSHGHNTEPSRQPPSQPAVSPGPDLVPGPHYRFQGTNIQDYLRNGEIEQSVVRFHNGDEETFHYTTENPWDTHNTPQEHTHDTGGRSNGRGNQSPQPQHPTHTFNQHVRDGVMMFRDYRIRRALKLSVLNARGLFVMLYPTLPAGQAHQHTTFTTSERFQSGTADIWNIGDLPMVFGMHICNVLPKTTMNRTIIDRTYRTTRLLEKEYSIPYCIHNVS